MRTRTALLLALILLVLLVVTACRKPNEPETFSLRIGNITFPTEAPTTEHTIEDNPFQIGQIIYPSEAYATEHTPEEVYVARRGAKVLDITVKLVRVEYSDGRVDTLSHLWFEPSEMILTEEWALGNPYHAGDEICVIPNFVGESFPDTGTVERITEDHVIIEGYNSLLHWTLFQYCN